VTGSHLLTLAPVIWPARILSFRADVQVHGETIDLALQPLDGVSKAPVGTPWTVTGVTVSADGRFAASFGTQAVPVQAYPLLNDPLLTVNDFVLTGATTSGDGFCGSIGGYARSTERRRRTGSVSRGRRSARCASPQRRCPPP
jgi:hypothetical protein